jgi:inorganic pyrophosphatase
MTIKLSDIDPGERCPDTVRAIVEIPRGSPNKYEYDVALGVFRLDRPLYSPMHYPGDYGFIPGTLAEDGDPVDVLTLVEAPSFTGCLIEVRPVGLLDMLDNFEADQKVLAVPARDPRYDQVREMDGVPDHTRKEIEHFFQIYKELEGKTVRTKGWLERAEACRYISKGRERFLSGG